MSDQAIDYDVEFRAITKRFGSLVAVNGVSLKVRKGEFLSLLGPSGCGKTTSLRMIAGFEQPDEGELLIGGSDAVGIPPYRRDVNTVFQQYALFPHMSILDNVCYGLKQRKVPRRERRAKAGEALELVQLTGRDSHRPAMLSGGQQQRVALARARGRGTAPGRGGRRRGVLGGGPRGGGAGGRPRVMTPRVRRGDEPLGALDLKLRKEMQIELKRIQDQVGITFIYVTHDQEEALSMSDRVAVMSNGVIEQLDTPRAIYDHPLTAFVADFIGDMNFLEGRVAESADGGYAIDAGEGVVVRGRGRPAGGAIVRVGIRPERIVVERGNGSGTANSARCEVLTKMYLGDQVQLILRLANGSEFVVREQRTSAAPAIDSLDPGDTATARWDEAAPLLMADLQPQKDAE